MHEGSRRAIIAAFLANLGIAVAKFVAFLFTGAASMLAETVHSLADTGNQALLLLGQARARRAADPDHPFGFGHERYFWSFVVALVLFSMGSLFAIYEGVEKLRHPHELVAPQWAIGCCWWRSPRGLVVPHCVRRSECRARQQQPVSFIRRAKSPELPVVLLEDTGALLGLVFALLGVGLAVWTGDALRRDRSVAIGILLGAIAFVLAAEMKSLLIGESASPDVKQIRRRHRNRRTRLATDPPAHPAPRTRGLLVGAKVEFASSLDVPGLARAIDEVEARVRAVAADARVIYIERHPPFELSQAESCSSAVRDTVPVEDRHWWYRQLRRVCTGTSTIPPRARRRHPRRRLRHQRQPRHLPAPAASASTSRPTPWRAPASNLRNSCAAASPRCPSPRLVRRGDLDVGDLSPVGHRSSDASARCTACCDPAARSS
jgi:cation diffusion facilitator family transporter